MIPCTTLLAQEQGTDSLVLQVDTTVEHPEKTVLELDTTAKEKFDPRKATIRSALIPGWGQAYNKKYWKIPIIYGALGVSAGVFIFNLDTYKELRQAVIWKSDTIPANDTLISPELSQLSASDLRYYRDAYRQNIDYSVLAFLVLWGLNVVDATVDAHLKAFNVSPDISLKVKPSYHYWTSSAGLSLTFTFNYRKKYFNLPK